MSATATPSILPPESAELTAAAAAASPLWKTGDPGSVRPWTRPDGAAAMYTYWKPTVSEESGEGSHDQDRHQEPGQPEPHDQHLRAKRIIVAIHGISGAPSDFVPLGHTFSRRGTHVFAPQMRAQGHETDADRRGDITSAHLWLNDIRHFLQLARDLHPGLPLYLYGESMGAILSINTVHILPKDELPAGAIFASPVFAIDNPPPWWREMLYNVLMRLLPSKRVRVGEFKTKREKELRITRDNEYQVRLHESAHYVNSYTLRFFGELRKLIHRCPEAAAALTIPVWVPYAMHDIFIRPTTVEAFWQLARNPNVQLKRYDESHHLLLHDSAMDEVLADLEKWLKTAERNALHSR
ncbi:MAG: alpha/beta hydrolase [Candidatus Methylacidiphilales bacterium]